MTKSHRMGGALAALGLLVALASPVVLVARPAAAAYLPPASPPQNIPATGSNYLQATDHARATEGVQPMILNPAGLAALPIPVQLFAITNLERIARGEPPLSAMTAELDSYAQVGANDGGDPPLPATFAGGGPNLQGGGNWIGGTSSALVANYVWMYNDGWGGSLATTDNIDCQNPSASGCWGHRTNILFQYSSCGLLGLFGGAPTLVFGAAYSPTGFENGPSLATIYGSTCGPTPTDELISWAQVQALISAPIISITSTPDAGGYWLLGADGSVQNYGDAGYYGSMVDRPLNKAIVGMASTPDGKGYWLVGADGGIFSFGDARYLGSTGALHLNAPIVGMAATYDGGGYWFVAADGGVFSFGDAHYLGSMGGKHLNQPVVGMAADDATGGYWLVAADGGVFSFAAKYYGSTGTLHLVQPIEGIETDLYGTGYRFVASDGGVFSFSVPFEGSEGGGQAGVPIVGLAPAGSNGYWLASANGGVFSFGAARFYGSPL